MLISLLRQRRLRTHAGKDPEATAVGKRTSLGAGAAAGAACCVPQGGEEARLGLMVLYGLVTGVIAVVVTVIKQAG